LISGRSTAGRQDQKRKERRTGKGQAKEREKTTIKTLICYQVIWIFVGAFDHDKSEQLTTNTFGYVTLHEGFLVMRPNKLKMLFPII